MTHEQLLGGVSVETFLNGKIELHCGDCLDVLPTLAGNSIDSVVCDPPYHLTSIVKRFANARPESEYFALSKSKSAYMSRGFMGKQWDGGDVAFSVDTWAQVWRALKPGGHLIAFGGTRTFARMSVAIEDAGFEIRDTIMWIYGSGFPKSHDVSKGIDRALGCERGKVCIPASQLKNPPNLVGGAVKGDDRPWRKSAMARGFHEAVSDEAVSDEAVSWAGWGTALKPACEPIVLARKPLSESTIAANVLKWGTGAINVDGCRVGIEERTTSWAANKGKFLEVEDGYGLKRDGETTSTGRWPANIITDGSEEVVAGFPESSAGGFPASRGEGGIGNNGHKGQDGLDARATDAGSAARYFYTAKADSDDRLGSRHPTVKPLDLMQYLVRLVTPPQGTVLDPFAGTGTTGEAAWREGFPAVLIEREAEYQADIRRRMKLCLSGPDERARESIKAKLSGKPQDHGPLFAES